MPDIKTKKQYARGDVIAAEGEYSFEWFILLSGSVGVFKKDVLVETFTEAGNIFGELSTILTRPRTATLKALNDTEILRMGGEHTSLDDLITQYPDLTKKILVNLAERLAKTTEELWTSIHN